MLKNPKRLLLSIYITLLIPLVLGVIAWLSVDVMGLEFPERTVTVIGYLFGWPLLVLGPLIPASDSPDPNAPHIRSAFYLVGVLCDFIVYWLLIYALLTWRARGHKAVILK